MSLLETPAQSSATAPPVSTRAQKREAVDRELRDNPNRSDNQIAGICGVDHKTVAARRREIGNSQPPTATEHREMLIEGVKDFDARQPTAEQAVDNAIASGKVEYPSAGEVEAAAIAAKYVAQALAAGKIPPPPGVVDKPEWDPFEPDCDALVVPAQPAIAVYANTAGSISIRQPADNYDEDDLIITIQPEHVEKLVARLRKVADA